MDWRGPNKPVLNEVPVRQPNKLVETPGMLPDQNRAFQKRRDTDTIKGPTVTLLDIDTAIITYLDEVINLQVEAEGKLVKVPINYASPERWKAIRKDGYMRDKNGKIICPALVLRRTTMQRNDTLITFNRYLTYPTIKKYSEKNKYDKFSIMNGFAPVKEIFSVTEPDHVIINYDYIVWTDYLEQLGSLVESLNFSTEDYWGKKIGFRFRTSISDYAFQTEVASDSDRIVKATFSQMVYAYLLPSKFEDHRPTTQKSFTPRKVVFNAETVTDLKKMRRKHEEPNLLPPLSEPLPSGSIVIAVDDAVPGI